LHPFVSDNAEFVWKTVRRPFRDYLKTYRDLSRNGHSSHALAGQRPSAAAKTPSNLDSEIEALLDNAVDRYLGTSGLFGTPEICLQMIDKLRGIGVDEVACLVDFGVETDLVLASLRHLKELQEKTHRQVPPSHNSYTLSEQLVRHGVTHLQCTPSLAGMLIQDPSAHKALRSLRKLLLGGEALPDSLVKQLEISGEILNMYGPT